MSITSKWRMAAAALVGAATAMAVLAWRPATQIDAPPPIPASTTAPRPQPKARPGVHERFVSETSVAALRRELSGLRAEVTALREALRDRASTAPAAQDAGPVGEPLAVAPLDPEAELAAETAEVERASLKRMEAIEAVLNAEPVDSRWADTARATVREALGVGLDGAAIADVDCRSTLCRVELRHLDGGAAAALQRRFPLRVGRVLPRLRMHRLENPDGSITTLIYLARAGHRFPKPDPAS